jgi:phosphate transport system permease protein
MNRRLIKQNIGFLILKITILITILTLFVFFLIVFVQGGKVISIPFITQIPKCGMTKGGIFPAIVGTFYLTLFSIIIALPIGVLTAIYLSEYGEKNRLMSIIEISINTLAGIPSIVYGLFGLALFVDFFGFGVSILSGSLTLSILILPTIIKASEEAIKSVPVEFKEASYALGATKRETITKVILPAALPGILTGAIISVGRAAGETAPILFTAATFYIRKLPKSIMDEVMALPYHIYALMTEGTSPKHQVPIAYGTALILILLILIINGISIYIRYRIRRSKKW